MIESLRNIKRKLKIACTVNWVKTLYFNFKMFPFSIAKKLPVFFYGSVKFTSLKGVIEIEAPIKTAMIGFGQPFEMTTRSKKIGEIHLDGDFRVKGHIQFGKDYFFYVGKSAYFEMGHMSGFSSFSKLICTNRVVLGKWVRLGSETQIIDTNFHQMMNTNTKEKYPKSSPIVIGDFNSISNRTSIMAKTITPNYCVIGSNSLCNKDYTDFGEKILIGGVPSKLIKTNFSRDWEGEKELMNSWLKVKF